MTYRTIGLLITLTFGVLVAPPASHSNASASRS